ncbi:hypothetical protein [Burkholderia sp. 9120]|uniref:hypothetical protein n=1 Tax=Burkholderia sp. 9120 TaxID=1500897 RepID=UPI0009DE8DE6|nr:hypothetical protein [Burkholderia sp. 9120]
MQHFSIGIVSVVFAVLFAGAVVVRYAGVLIKKWYQREDGPKDRILVGIVAAAAFGFVAGSFVQPAWDKAEVCKANGEPIVPCAFNSGS